MECFTQYTRSNPDTVNGYKIIVTQTYTSFNEKDIDMLEEQFKQSIGNGIRMTFNKDENVTKAK